MLVLSRRLNETIVIDDRIRITVLRISGDKIRLGIECDKGIIVDREEIHQRRHATKEEAST